MPQRKAAQDENNTQSCTRTEDSIPTKDENQAPLDTGNVVRCSNLQRKFLRLSVAIEDKNKSIDLLLNAIHDHDIQSQQEYENANATCRLQFEEKSQSKERQAEISQLLNQWSDLIEEKKSLTTELDTLLEQRQNQQQEWMDIIEGRRRSFSHDGNDNDDRQMMIDKHIATIHELRDELMNLEKDFANGAEERKATYMEQKIQNVKRATLEALQPEINRLKTKHECDMEELRREMQSKKECIERDMKREYQERIDAYRQESQNRLRVLVAKRKEQWLQKIHNIKAEYEEQWEDDVTNKTPRVAMERLIEEQDNELKEVKEKHRLTLLEMEAANDAKLEELEKAKKSEMEKIDQTMNDQKQELQEKYRAKKEAWREQERAKMEQNLQEELKNITVAAKKDRDEKIDAIIRSCQAEESKYEEEFKKKCQMEMDQLRKEHEEEIRGIEEDLERARREDSEAESRLAKIQEAIQSNDEKGERMMLHIRQLEGMVDEIERKTAEIKEKGIPIDSSKQSRLDEMELELSEKEREQQKLEDEIKLVKQDIEDCKSQDEVEEIKRAHRQALQKKEDDVKRTICGLNDEIKEADLTILTCQERLEKLRELMTSYTLQNTGEGDAGDNEPSMKITRDKKKTKKSYLPNRKQSSR